MALGRRTRRRALIAVTAVATIALGLATAGSAQAVTTITIAPNTPNAANSFPFGRGTGWTPFMGWIHKNIPAFQLKTGDTLAFDLGQVNNANIQLDIAMAPTTVNGGDVPAGAFTTVVTNTQTPANPMGNTVDGDFELRFTAQAPFNFAGGGLIIRFSNPSATYAADTMGNTVLENGGGSGDSSGFFLERFVGDADGVFPWGFTDLIDIGAFRLILADVPAPPVTPTPVTPSTPKKKCKKKKRGKKGAAAAKKCKRKKRRK